MPPLLPQQNFSDTMKNNIRFSLKTLAVIAIILLAKPLSSQQNAIRMTPLQPVIGKFSLNYERAFSSKTTFMVEYQRWFERRTAGAGLWLLGIPAFSWDETYNKGFRMSAFVRQYGDAAMQGVFIEGGLYFGQHDITTRSETTVIDPNPIFIFDFVNTVVEEQSYDDVGVYGLRLGGGWHKAKGSFSLEFSGGFNYNGNSQGVRPTLGMKEFAPYTRFALGVAF